MVCPPFLPLLSSYRIPPLFLGISKEDRHNREAPLPRHSGSLHPSMQAQRNHEDYD